MSNPTFKYLVKKRGRGNFKKHEVQPTFTLTDDQVMIIESTFLVEPVVNANHCTRLVRLHDGGLDD